MLRFYLHLIFILLTACFAVAAPQGKRSVPSGFVTANGQLFEVDGESFAFVGANSYWLPLLLTQSDVEKTMADMHNAGIKVLRTWGFNAINASELATAKTTNLTYYQVWDNGDWTVNTGPQGLLRLDHVIDTAAKYDIKVILTFTNNWVGYGGMELYINWIAGSGQTHDVFFTDPKIIASYQRYVKVIVDRYKSSPTIFAWELMNEARCSGDLPAGPACVAGTELIPKWYKQQSDFVRSLDPHHMITTGGEGMFYWRNSTDYNFDGDAGEDFDTDIAYENIDFGVYHMYPQTWYPSEDFPGSNFSIEDWGNSWIRDHASSTHKVNKPVVLEEFGVTGLENKTHIYPSWVKTALGTNHAIMPWQFGELGLTEGNRIIKYTDEILDGASPNDGYAIYKNQTAIWDLFTFAYFYPAPHFSSTH